MLLLLTIYCFCLSSFGQNKSLTFSTWIFTWDSLCDNFPVQDYYVFFPDSIVINQTMEDNVCSMGKYVLQDSLVFMKFYCDEKNYYYDTEDFEMNRQNKTFTIRGQFGHRPNNSKIQIAFLQIETTQ